MMRIHYFFTSEYALATLKTAVREPGTDSTSVYLVSLARDTSQVIIC